MLRSIRFSISAVIILFLLINNSFAQTEESAPDFILETIDGTEIQLSEEIGDGPIVVTFWATWCKPCAAELKEYSKIYDEYSVSGLKMFAISIDNEKSIAKVKPTVKSKKYKFPVLLDRTAEVARNYFATAVPYTIIINTKGEIVYSHFGYKKGDELKLVDEFKKYLVNK